jgi:hypothetical protein
MRANPVQRLPRPSPRPHTKCAEHPGKHSNLCMTPCDSVRTKPLGTPLCLPPPPASKKPGTRSTPSFVDPSTASPLPFALEFPLSASFDELPFAAGAAALAPPGGTRAGTAASTGLPKWNAFNISTGVGKGGRYQGMVYAHEGFLASDWAHGWPLALTWVWDLRGRLRLQHTTH